MSAPLLTRTRSAGLRSLGVALALLASSAVAEPSSPRDHDVSVFLGSNVLAYLSSSRTIGGVGGGVGIRDTLQDRFLLQADLSYLAMIGNVLALRVGAGVQRSGVYTPAALLKLSVLFGDHMNFLSEQHPTPVQWPAASLGVDIMPLRFSLNGTQISLLALGVGVGTDMPGLGLTYHLGIAEIAASL